jgi:hypothetical protein
MVIGTGRYSREKAFSAIVFVASPSTAAENVPSVRLPRKPLNSIPFGR